MQFDLLSILLGILCILIFMAIFALLRTMSSPYIKRFELMLRSKFIPMSYSEGSGSIKFAVHNRFYELFEIKIKNKPGEKTAYNHLIFLQAKTSSRLSLKFLDIVSEKPGKKFFYDIIGIVDDPHYLSAPTSPTDQLFKDFYLTTNDVSQAKQFMQNEKSRSVVQLCKSKTGPYRNAICLVIEPGTITLDYRFTETLLQELINNPRNIRRHISMLSILSQQLEAIDKETGSKKE
jgi:hypothetical protein